MSGYNEKAKIGCKIRFENLRTNSKEKVTIDMDMEMCRDALGRAKNTYRTTKFEKVRFGVATTRQESISMTVK